MKLAQSILCGVALLALANGAAWAGEDSTDRWHGTGPHYYETKDGLAGFDQSQAEGSWPGDHFVSDLRRR